MKKALVLGVAAMLTAAVWADSQVDLFDPATAITWLGLDFTQVRFIGTASQWQETGEIDSDKLREKYFPSWNSLFVNEAKKYNVAKAVHRSSVAYAAEVTDKANNAATKQEFFSSNPDDYQGLEEKKIAALVKRYDFKGRNGVGLMFFVEGMSKAREEASMWVTFVNMDKRTVLLAKRVTGAPQGIGFRNYWARCFLNVLKRVEKDFESWK